MGKPVTRGAAALHADHVRRRQPVVLVRQRRASGGPATCRASSARRPIGRAPVPNSELSPDGKLRGLHHATTTCGSATSTTGAGQAADDRRRQGLRLRHRQRRLDQQRSPGAQVVARLEEDRHLPAGSAQGRRDVSRQHRRRAIRRCRPGSIRCPATSMITMIERVDHRGRRAEGDPPARWARTSTARRSATTSSAAASGSTCSGVRTAARWRSSRRRATISRRTCASPTPATGAIRDVLEEKGETFLESGNGRVNWKYLPGSNEAIWFSQRDNWGQLYLHDLQTGKLKHPITSGEGNVTQLLRVDEADPHRLLPGRRQGARTRSVLPPLLSRRHGRQAARSC